MLSEDDRRHLLAIARKALEARVTRGCPPAVDDAGALALRCGAFVSIHWRGDLRGCLGRLTVDAPLGRTVMHLASVVADSDPRFAAVSELELPEIRIEISVLTPERAVTTIDEIEVGRHGLIVEDRRARGLLLPQVAVEHGWARETFLAHTCLKAGLAADAWRNGARILVFEAEVFGESATGAVL